MTSRKRRLTLWSIGLVYDKVSDVRGILLVQANSYETMLRAARAWTYEREWRVIGDVGPITYDRPHAIRRIFFGSRIKADHKAQILSAIEGTKIEVYMMEIEGWLHYWDEVSVKSKPRKFGRIR
jgi:hypothetical protein